MLPPPPCMSRSTNRRPSANVPSHSSCQNRAAGGDLSGGARSVVSERSASAAAKRQPSCSSAQAARAARVPSAASIAANGIVNSPNDGGYGACSGRIGASGSDFHGP
ncbi:MAG: hypothetical protein KDC48_01555 [Planctomycetes bacterium]|nr:hypothetical protein [Planctomycetota bacterium]